MTTPGGERRYEGKAIVVASWAGVALLAVGALPPVFGLAAFGVVSLSVSLLLFAASLFVWAWAFAVAIARSAAGEDVVVANLFLFDGRVPRRVRLHLFGSLAVCTVLALAVAVRDPFTVLAPMWPLGCVGLWGARHGEFPPRADAAAGPGGR